MMYVYVCVYLPTILEAHFQTTSPSPIDVHGLSNEGSTFLEPLSLQTVRDRISS